MIFYFPGRSYIKTQKWINFNSILEIKYELPVHRFFFFVHQRTKTNTTTINYDDFIKYKKL